MEQGYPVSLRLRGRLCVVVGGGTVATRKVELLLRCGAQVRVVAPRLARGLAELAAQGKIQAVRRRFRPEDVKGAFLLIAASNDAQTNAAAARAARAAGALVNVVDAPELCDFFVPAVADLGGVVVAISTSGKSPALARWLRERLEEQYGGALGELAEMLGEVREELRRKFPSAAKRRAVLRRIVNSEALDLLREGRRDEARERIARCISSQLG